MRLHAMMLLALAVAGDELELPARPSGPDPEPDPGPDPDPGPPIIGGHGGDEAPGAAACRRCGRALGYHADDLSTVCAACDACDDGCDDG